MKKLAIITSHPIQYNAPLYRLLATRNNIKIKVFYTWGQSKDTIKYDPGFKKDIAWDIPLLDGYEYEFINNISIEPGSHHFNGIQNPSIIKDLSEYDPDAILITGWSFKSHLKIIRHFKGVKKIIFRGDSNLIDEPKGLSFKKIARRIFLTWVYHFIDVALYVGTANKEYYLRYGLKDTQLIFAPHAIDNERFIEQADRNKNIILRRRELLGIPSDSILFLFAGKFESKKNPTLLMDAFIKLDDTNTHLLFVGNGIEEENLKVKAAGEKEELSKRIHFLPFQNQSNMPDIYSMADVFCLPSQGPGETWGLAVNEAMACSKVILVSDKCGCNIDLVKNGINGYIVKSNHVDDLYAKMKLQVVNKNNLPAMGLRSLEIIQQWSYEKVCIAIESAVV